MPRVPGAGRKTKNEWTGVLRLNTSSWDTIYLEGEFSTKDETFVSPESLMVLFTLQCCKDLDINIVFTSQSHLKLEDGLSFPLGMYNEDLTYSFKHLKKEQCPEMIQNCQLPAVFIENEPWVVVGLSSSVRHILRSKTCTDSQHLSSRLLGFRMGCLQACAEVSVWTKFCEVEAVEMLKEILFKFKVDTSLLSVTVPDNIIRYERHLEHPPILHNGLKRKQENLEKVIKDKATRLEMKKKKLKELPDLEHKYAEGVDLTLADLLLYVSFSLCMRQLGKILNFQKICPLAQKWLLSLENVDYIAKAKNLFRKVLEEHTPLLCNGNLKILYPDIPDESLYNSDPNRYKPRWRSFTHQEDIDEVIGKLEEVLKWKTEALLGEDISQKLSVKKDIVASSDLKNLMQGLCLEDEFNIGAQDREILFVSSISFANPLKWESFPQAVNPADGDLPLKRLERKCQQLESLVQVVIAMAKHGDTIVDFCAGGGHLGILLAYCLPNCKILLVENKTTSLDKAYKRVKALNMINVYFYQCNLDYFYATFNIGVCLHACGVATDLVMQKCFSQKASFVCSPCCYGSVRPNHILSYPRSFRFTHDLQISLSEYLILGHAADQTHDKHHPKTEQGKRCMQYVDFDRLAAAQKLGYGTLLNIMNPPECTPKNHILIGAL